MQAIKLTERQREVLAYVARCQVVNNGYERSVLLALEKKGLVINHTAPQTSTWTLSDLGAELDSIIDYHPELIKG